MQELWPCQDWAIKQVCEAICAGHRRILLTLPTGMGKTLCASELIRLYLDEGRKCLAYTNRRILIDQTSRVMAAAGHDHGVRASGHEDRREQNFQISSIQTEVSRVLKRGQWELHEAEFVVVDEAHLQGGPKAREILKAHHDMGAIILGLTATPIGLGGQYDVLIVGGTNSDGRACGALVPAHHFGCDSPDLKSKDIGYVAVGEDLTEVQNVKAMMRPGLFGRVVKWYNRLNPAQAPTLLFAPGVKESAWFAEQFSCPDKRDADLRGYPPVRAAHLDGQEVWLDGEFQPTGRSIREDVLEQFRRGEIKVICNRFVCREGIDLPCVEHVILATVIGSLQSYLQVVGRGLRASPETNKTHCTIQDHGDCWSRHGSANADREWNLEYTAGMISGLREDRLRSKQCLRCRAKLRPGKPLCLKCGQNNEVEPTRCPECGRIVFGERCPRCGRAVDPSQKMRPVVQSDGSLKELRGDAFPPRREFQRPNGPALWKRMYFRACSEHLDEVSGEMKGWSATFRQAMALFAAENHWQWPKRTWPWMPTRELDFYRLVKNVPREFLVPESPIEQ